MLLVRWLNWKPGAVEADVEEDSEAVPKTFDELVGWIQERFSLQDFGCKINFSELRCSTLPPLDGASGMFSTIKFDHTVIDAKKYTIARVVAHMRGQLWLTFETIDEATRCSSTPAPASVGGCDPCHVSIYSPEDRREIMNTHSESPKEEFRVKIGRAHV